MLMSASDVFLISCSVPTNSAISQLIADLVTADGNLVPEETSTHTLRNTFTRNYFAQYPGDLVGLAMLLSHSSLDTTRLYSQHFVEQFSTQVEQLNVNASAAINGFLGLSRPERRYSAIWNTFTGPLYPN